MASCPIYKGEFVCEYVGEHIPEDLGRQRHRSSKTFFSYVMFMKDARGIKQWYVHVFLAHDFTFSPVSDAITDNFALLPISE